MPGRETATSQVSLGGRSLFSLSTIAIALLVLALVLYPLSRLFSRGFTGGWSAWLTLADKPWIGGMFADTVFVIGTSAIISLLLAALLAWVNERTNAGFGTLGDALPLVPLFLPSVAQAIGWVMLANPTVGYLNGFLDATLGQVGLDVALNIYSYPGLIFVYVMHLVPYAYLPIMAGFRTLDPSLEEAARLSGASPFKVFTSVSIRSIAPSLVSALLLVSVVGFAMFSIPVIIGVRPEIDILSVRIIRSIRATYPADYGTAARLSAMLFLLLASMWYIQRRLIGAGRFAKVGQRTSGGYVANMGPWRWPLRLVIIGYIALAAILPIAALALVSFQGYWQPDILDSTWTLVHYDRILFGAAGGIKAMQHSLTLGLGAGGITVLIAALMMVYSHRSQNQLGRITDGVAKVPAAIPNTVIAVAFVLALAGPPFNLGGTFLILILGYFVVYLPYASLSTEASVAQVDRSLEEASALSGAKESRTFRKIVVPLIAPGIFAAWALVFVRILGELSLAVLLSTGRTAVIGYVLLDVWEQGTFGGVAALALLMTAVTMPIVLIMLRLGRPRWNRKAPSRRFRFTRLRRSQEPEEAGLAVASAARD